MVLPRCNHNVPSDAYFVRRKMDYFVRNLLGAEDPGIFEGINAGKRSSDSMNKKYQVLRCGRLYDGVTQEWKSSQRVFW